jgi:16S rRNA C967 or C1407 C5-methylase (RsmB/RsmF family)/NOL1/NOP2/fmu family ribosome biogenesis protein
LHVQFPIQLLESLEGLRGFDRNAFEKVHQSANQVTSVRLNPGKTFNIREHFKNITRVPWSEMGYYLSERPSFTFDPLFHAGCYYVQEASSMFLEQAFTHLVDQTQPIKVLDLSAAPGGKSTHIQSLIGKGSLLVSNEVIRSRANILTDNLVKWGSDNVCVTNNDPRDFSRLEAYFDVIVVDAPCSGSGLFRRDAEAIEEWSEKNVELCSQRQQRILADVLPALKRNGILIYSTCSYSPEEDEEIVDWLLGDFLMEYLPIGDPGGWGIADTGKGYRFWPDKVKGEGFFMAAFQKKEGEDDTNFRLRRKVTMVDKKEDEVISNWVKTGAHTFIKNNSSVYAWPTVLVPDLSILLERLKVIYSGILIGEIIREKLIPDHALAMSSLTNEDVGRIKLNSEQVIKFLQRKEIGIDTTERGWKLVTFHGKSLGWVNILQNRVNNYYPKELRILKEN